MLQNTVYCITVIINIEMHVTIPLSLNRSSVQMSLLIHIYWNKYTWKWTELMNRSPLSLPFRGSQISFLHAPSCGKGVRAVRLVCKQLLFCFCLSEKTGWFQQALSNSVYVLCNVLCKCTPLNINSRSVWKNANILIVSWETALW